MILIVEDDKDINNLIKELLSERGFETHQVFDGAEAVDYLKNNEVDLMLLDLMMPKLMGEDVINYARSMNMKMPIIVLSAKIDKATRLGCLDLGCDDFIMKPFDTDELISRVRAQLRRSNAYNRLGEKAVRFEDFYLDNDNNVISFKEVPLNLTRMEYKLLRLLIENPKKVFTKENLYRSVWEDDIYSDNTINVHISNLRNKLKEIDPDHKYIKTVWSIGYILK